MGRLVGNLSDLKKFTKPRLMSQHYLVELRINLI